MRYVDEFRDPALARRLVKEIRRRATRPVRLMEFCGGHTHVIFRFGLRQMLAPQVELRSGPGCPVCVTSAADLDRAIALAELPDAILTTFGDLVRVPGSRGTLQEARAQGADVRVVYSAMDALEIARRNPARPVIFLGIGFETTAPTVAAALVQAESERLPNFTVFSLHKLTPPAVRAILEAGEVALDGIIGPGHVSTIVGSDAWQFLPRQYDLPCAVSGFEPLDILGAVMALVSCVAEGESAGINAYGRGVRPEGNRMAQALMEQVFRVGPAEWRGFGMIPASGLHLREEFAHRDAALRFQVEVKSPWSADRRSQIAGCRCGEVLRSVVEPPDCPLFRRVCSPRTPVGPCMVSAEGACAAYFQYTGPDDNSLQALEPVGGRRRWGGE
jgi:hydrogenase expression/formation protein HypD